MPLNDANIFRYNFSSRSNKAWNFQLEFLRGSNTAVGTYDSEFLPPMFFDEISILSDFEEGLPFGKQKASLLNLKIDFGVLQGDFTVLKNWILIGGQVITNEFYPNQWRILSNNGRGVSDVTYDVVEFWGCQDVIPEQEYTFKFGETQTFDLKVLSIENFIFNKITDHFYNNGASITSNQVVNYQNFSGVNSGSQTVRLASYSALNRQSFSLFTPALFTTNLLDFITEIAQYKLRNWLLKDTSSSNAGVIGNTNTFLTNWSLKKQLYDLTTQEGAGLGSNADIKMVGSIIVDSVTVGGLCSDKSKEGFYQFKNCNDLLNSLCEQFISKLTFKYNRNDTLNSVRLNLNFKAPYDSLAGGSISLGADNIAGEVKLIRGVYAIAESTVSYKAYKQNQNKNTYKVYGSLKQDSFDNKALFTNNVQVPELNNYLDAIYGELPYILINQLFYIRETNEVYLTHANCSVMLGTETTKTIYNESITGDTIDPADNKSSGNKEINRAKLIEWANVRYNKSGLNYVQSKAYASIMNDKAMLLECEVLDYLIKPRDVGDKIVSDLSTILNLPSEWFFSTNHVLTSCEIDLLTGISKIKLFIRGE
jgi:hypothetical protein